MPRQKKKQKKPENIIAALYCRVSTYDQTILDYSSLDHQEEELRAWCKRESYKIHDVYIDSAKSGSTIKKRTSLQRLLSDAKDEKFNIILFTNLDRVSRSAADWFDILGIFKEHNIEINSLNHNLSNDDPYGRMFRNMLIIFAELERELTAERTFEKAYSTAKKGKFIGGTPPMGYILQNKKMVQNPKYSKLIKRIYKEYLNDKKPAHIARDLNKEGFRTPTRVTKNGKNKGEKRGNAKFSKNKIIDFLSNVTYTGVIKFHKETFPGEHKAIISKSLFEKVVKKKKKNAFNPGLGKPKTSDLLLLDLVKCGYCGSNMTTTQTKKPLVDGTYNLHYGYKCSKAQHFGSKECPGSQVTANGIEKFILDWLHRITEDKKEFRKISASQAVKKDNERMNKLKKIKSEILGNKKSIQLKLENLLATIESGNAPKTITKRIIELENDLKEIDNSIFKIDSELDYLKSRSMTPDDLLVYLKEIVPYMKEMGRDRLRDLLHLIIKDITIKKPQSPDEKWEIKISPWSYDPRAYSLDVLTGSCYRPSLLRRRDSNPRQSD